MGLAQVTTYSVFLQKLSQDSGSPTKDWDGERKAVDDGKDDASADMAETSAPSHTQEPQEFFATCMVLEYCDRGMAAACLWVVSHHRSTSALLMKFSHFKLSGQPG